MIKDRLSQVEARIEQACQRAGRARGGVRLVVVTKGHPAEAVAEAISAGARLLGENYLEEAVEKMGLIRKPPGVEWHMIGHIQSRKSARVAEHFDTIHSVDGLKLAERLNRSAVEFRRRIPILLEVNVSGEETKFGLSALGGADLEQLQSVCLTVMGLGNLQLRGLMTMAPYGVDPEAARPFFRRLRAVRDGLCRRIPGLDLPDLSMGMSGDFEVAIQEGATIVRIGEAIMGPRVKKV